MPSGSGLTGRELYRKPDGHNLTLSVGLPTLGLLTAGIDKHLAKSACNAGRFRSAFPAQFLLGGPEQHSGMAVVAAGVHLAQHVLATAERANQRAAVSLKDFFRHSDRRARELRRHGR
jgi:hypothetical protein